MAVQWSLTDLAASVAISGSSDNVATATAGGAHKTGRANAYATGKLYFEFVLNAYGGSASADAGFADVWASLSNSLGSGADYHSIGIHPTAGIYFNGTAQNDGTYSIGDRVAVAIETTNANGNASYCMVWWKNLTTGSAWHPSGDPNTLTGGFQANYLGISNPGTPGYPVTPAFTVYDTNDQITGYFSASQITGTVPTGFSLFSTPALAGAAAVNVVGNEIEQAAAAIAGNASVNATASGGGATWQASAALAASGTLSASLGKYWYATAAITGYVFPYALPSGALAAETALLAGANVSGIATGGHTTWQSSANLGSAAAMFASAAVLDAAIAAIGGSASVTANGVGGHIVYQGSAAIQAGAQLNFSFQGNWYGSATIAVATNVITRFPIPAIIPKFNLLPVPGDPTPYVNLITSEHSDKPNFVATVQATIQPFVTAMAGLKMMNSLYDLDNAVGAQLDVLGQWVGANRDLEEQITGVYFAWDTDGLGWEQGYWQGPFDPDEGIVVLPDDAFRTLIKAKIAANNWDGTIPGAYAIWELLFGDQLQLVIQDFQNMTMAIGIITPTGFIDPITLALLTQGKLDLRPAGVGITEYFTGSIPGTPVFSWDTPGTQSEAGWDIGVWSVPIQ